MRLAVDARELTGHPTGVGRYLAGVLREWQSTGIGHEVILYAHAPVAVPGVSFPVRVLPGSGGTVWEQTTLRRAIRADRASALYASGYTAPLLSGVPTAVIVHDISFVAHPEWFRPREGWRRRWLTRQSARSAAAVITVSRFSESEIVRHFGTPAHRIHVIPPAIEPPAIERARQGHGGDRVLYVGSIFNRRHVPALIEAAVPLLTHHPTAALDIVGDNRTYPHVDLGALIAALPPTVAPRVHWHRYVSEDQLRTLYSEARAFAYLSEYEGFGLTPLEALSVGIPAVLMDTPAGRETCGEAALFVAPGDTAATTRALEQLLFDGSTRDRILAAAPSVLARYSWPRTANATLAVLEAMAR